MRDEELDRRLRALPAACAGKGFASEVKRRIGARAATGSRWRRRGLVAAALALGALLGTGGWYRAGERQQAAERALLLVEQQRLVRELEKLRALAEERERIYLGSDTERVLYLDWTTVEAARERRTKI